MNITVHRGLNQIGGNIIEIESEGTKILFDIGLDLDPLNNLELPKIDNLFDSRGYDAIFISHYHSDHMGLVYEVNKEIPVYIGELSCAMIQASNRYLNKTDFKVAKFLNHKVPIQVGRIKVTPFLCDHSAFNSFMLFAESESGNVLYTGDFRANGRKPSEWLLNELPKNIDTLICEGTTLSRDGYKAQTETELETIATDLIKSHKGPVFVLQSSMNIDRIVTMYRAAKRSERIFLEDLFLAEITSSIRCRIPNPIDFVDVKVFSTYYLNKQSDRYKLFERYSQKRITKVSIAQSNFVMCVRVSMLDYLEKLSKKVSFENGLLIYSFWSGYLLQPQVAEFIQRCKEMGLEIVTLHTSGHADEETLMHLIELVNPKRIIPVHTENANWFINKYGVKID